ncbi:MAG: hypothetical protein IT537_13660 [Hyphomicrobiales bacterium]|nr:hypothetical protein [Hyphomicrobiales bacterium]
MLTSTHVRSVVDALLRDNKKIPMTQGFFIHRAPRLRSSYGAHAGIADDHAGMRQEALIMTDVL